MNKQEIELVKNKFLNLTEFEAQDRPVIYSMAGVPGAGKTTLMYQLIEAGEIPSGHHLHSPDDVMLSIPSYQKDLQQYGKVKAKEIWELPARELANEMLYEAIQRRFDIVYDRGGASHETLDDLDRAKNKDGYDLNMYVVSCDFEMAKQRASGREYHIEISEMERREKALQDLLLAYHALSDSIYYYDNSDIQPILLASKKAGKFEIFHDKAFQERYACLQSKLDIAS